MKKAKIKNVKPLLQQHSVSRNFDELTEMAKQTPLGQKIMQEMKPVEMWVNDISPDGKIIGRLEMISGRYENCG